jgi:Protein of unknown function with HXXEE motif
LNFVGLLVHQFEEYRYPGYFPGQMNAGISKSDKPDRYPLNPNLAMLINVVGGYPFYVLPVFFPNVVWLGLAPVLMGFSQVLGHGIFFNLRTKSLYSPGFFACFFLHLPIGILYIRQISADHLLRSGDWVLAGIYTILVAACVLAAPQQLFKDKNSPYRFTPRQMGRWGVSR